MSADRDNQTEPEVTLREITEETVVQICKLSDTLSEQHRALGFQPTGEMEGEEIVTRLIL